MKQLPLFIFLGRTARLVINLTLLQDGYPIVIIVPILRSDYKYYKVS
ncbi:MAG: hypothetical protein LBS29_01210 [Endomicrobium sp.]|nr:hypothetical protein [Endomicrobium sp.]